MGLRWTVGRKEGYSYGVRKLFSSWGNLDTCSESGPKMLGVGERSLRGLGHLFCPHLAGPGAWYVIWASKPGPGSDFASYAIGEALPFSRPHLLLVPGHGGLCPLNT